MMSKFLRIALWNRCKKMYFPPSKCDRHLLTTKSQFTTKSHFEMLHCQLYHANRHDNTA